MDEVSREQAFSEVQRPACLDALFYALSEEIGRFLCAHQAMLATVESCTGGGVAQVVTAVSGSSAWFDCGRVVYSNASKLDLIAPAVLETHGAVSEPVVAALVMGQLQVCRANFALGISGIAGPTGGTPTKPVGTVCFAWLRRGESPQTTTQQFSGNREAVRQQAIEFSLLELMRRYPTRED